MTAALPSKVHPRLRGAVGRWLNGVTAIGTQA
jgi:hypothetical protein